MQIHEVVHDTTLQVILNAVDDDLFANVQNFEVGILVFITVLVKSLVRRLIFADAIEKVLRSGFRILATVVRAGGLDVTDIRHDNVLIVALAFDEQNLDAVFDASLADPFSPLLGRIGSIEDRDNPSSAKPGEHVDDGCFCGGATLPLALGIVGVEEVGSGLWSIVAPIVADVESLRRYRQPLQVALGY